MEKLLPKNWVETTLGDVADWGSGGTPKRGVSNFYGGSIPWIKTGDLNDDIVEEVNEYITEEGIEKSSAKIFPKGSLGLAMYGATIGRTGLFGMDAATNQACAVASTYLEMNHFIHYLLKSEKKAFIDKGKGGAQPNISQTVIKAHEIKLPPLAEQQRIVAKLDALFGHLEQVKTRLANIPQLLKNFRQAILTQAVTGKLTEEWREGKELGEWDFDSLIEKRKKDFTELKALRKNNGQKAPSKPEYLNYKKEDITPFNIQKWIQAPVGFICDCIVPGRDKPKSFTGTLPWITTPDLTTDHISKENARLFLSDKEIKEVKAKIIPVDSVIISIVGRFGISCVIDDACVINQQLHAFLPSDLVLPKYLMYFFRTQESVMNALATSTTVAYINKTNANSIIVNLPPIEEQTEIVRRVESLFAKADAIEAKYKALKVQIDNLPQALLAKAFKGELVEQLDTDGDARDLLKEIKKLKG